MRTSRLIPLLLIAAACGSSQPISTSGGRAAIGVVLNSPVFFGSSPTAPANLDVVVENRSGAPIVVRNIRVESSGMMRWGIYPVQRAFRETLAPGELKAFPIFATAGTNSPRSTMQEPLTVRAVVQFDAGTERFQELFHGVAIQE